MGIDVQTRHEVGVDRGVARLGDDIATALVANDGYLHLSGRGNATAVDALNALRRVSHGAPLIVRDPNGATQGLERTTKNGPTVTSRRANRSRRWHLHVRALPADFTIELADLGGTAPLPSGAAVVGLSDIVSPDDEGPGFSILMHPALRLEFDSP